MLFQLVKMRSQIGLNCDSLYGGTELHSLLQLNPLSDHTGCNIHVHTNFSEKQARKRMELKPNSLTAETDFLSVLKSDINNRVQNILE